jgi:septum formation topological specificity factor MinE
MSHTAMVMAFFEGVSQTKPTDGVRIGLQMFVANVRRVGGDPDTLTSLR